jgi:hypothetical protein
MVASAQLRKRQGRDAYEWFLGSSEIRRVVRLFNTSLEFTLINVVENSVTGKIFGKESSDICYSVCFHTFR